MTCCPECGVEIEVGSWPFCPHGQGSYNAQGDEIDFWAETAFREPRHFTSQKAYEKALDEAGLRLNPHHVPGGKLANWATVDPQTLENARILVSRPSKATKDPDTHVNVTWTHRTLPGSFRVRAEE
jgi:hypothetical protein